MKSFFLYPIFFAAVALHAQTQSLMHASGPMDVKTQPDPTAPPGFGRFTLDKRYHGGLEAFSIGEMLGGGDLKGGNAGYVALETITGALDGRQGSFQLMHWGTMRSGKFDLRIEVVPGSGTDGLQGISGTLRIDALPGGNHTYTLDYTLPEKSPAGVK